MGRQKDDFYPTPPEATELLLTVEKFEGDVWECASGDGAISKCLQRENYNVISTDLNDYGYGETGRDFLQETKSLADNIVTNPPFKLAEDFIHKCVDLGIGKYAMFLRLSFLESQRRKELFENFPPKRIWVMSKRMTLWRGDQKRNGSGTTAYAWYVWEKDYKGKPQLWWL